MKKLRLFLLLIPLLMSSLNLLAWNDGDTFTNGIYTYRVVSAENSTVRIIACTGSGTVTIPSSVSQVDETFSVVEIGPADPRHGTWSSSITGVAFAAPCNVARILSYAFYGTKITSLTIPATVTDISPGFFTYAPSTLKEINVNTNNPRYQSSSGVLYTKGLKALLFCPKSYSGLSASNTTFSIPNGVDSIMENAFTNVANLKTLSIPASVSHIRTESYSIVSTTTVTAINVNASNANYCSVDGVLFTKDMKTLVRFPAGKNINGSYTIPNGVKEIAPYAFHRISLTSLNFNQVEEVRGRAFYTSNYLATINIPASMRIIDAGAFSSMYSISKVTVDGNNSHFTVINDALYSANGDTLKYYPPFRQGGATYNIAPNTVVVEARAFESMRNVTTVTIPQTVKELGGAAFYQAYSMKNITFLPTSQLKKIGAGCFYSCDLLENIDIPASVDEIRASAFGSCPVLKTVTVGGNSQLKTIGASCFGSSPNLTSFTFSGDISRCRLDSIGTGAFRDTKLASFSFPPTIRHIGESAFNGCTALNSVTFSDYSASAKLDTICGGAFANTPYTFTRLPASVKCIGREAFWNGKTAATLSISEKTDSISPEAFKGCYTLQHLDVAKTNPKYSSVDGMLLSKNKETLILFPPGKANDEFTLLAPSITKIGDYVFYDNTRLKNVVIPNKVASIGRRAFGLCTALNTITFLCDEMIDPDNIAQGRNMMAFDNGLQAPTMFSNIDINVRKEKLDDYVGSSFYSQFRNINPSYEIGTEEYIAVSQNAVDLLSTKSPNHTLVLPKTVTHNGQPYDVALLGDYAFESAPASVREVVVPDGVEYIGAKAFVKRTGTPVENIFFLSKTPTVEMLSTTRFELDDTGTDYSEIAPSTKVYVKKSALSAYKTAFSRYIDGVSGIGLAGNSTKFDYQIPLPMATTFTTFAREFDADFSEYSQNNTSTVKPGWPKVVAFTAGEYKTDGKDASGNPMNYVIMKSINENAAEGDGTYIPAGTGVLLKAIDGYQNTPDFYYQIHENELSPHAGSNLLTGMTEITRTVQPTEVKNGTAYTNFIVSGNQLHKMTVARNDFPVHKSYLQIPTSMIPTTTGAKMMFLFKGLDDDVITSIDSSQLTVEGSANGEIYDLQGRRVTAPAKGIYVRNGKKVIIK